MKFSPSGSLAKKSVARHKIYAQTFCFQDYAKQNFVVNNYTKVMVCQVTVKFVVYKRKLIE